MLLSRYMGIGPACSWSNVPQKEWRGGKETGKIKRNKHKEHDTNGTGYLLSFVCVVLDQINPQKRKKQKKVHGKMVNDASYESRLDRILKQHKSNSSFLSSCIWQRRRKERKKGKEKNQGISLLGDSCIISALSNAHQNHAWKTIRRKADKKG